MSIIAAVVRCLQSREAFQIARIEGRVERAIVFCVPGIAGIDTQGAARLAASTLATLEIAACHPA